MPPPRSDHAAPQLGRHGVEQFGDGRLIEPERLLLRAITIRLGRLYRGSGSGGSAAGLNAIAAKVSPALVDINSTFGYQSAQGAGTGIVLTSNGEILTNNHVIDGATKISVTDIGNGKTYNATVVGYDSTPRRRGPPAPGRVRAEDSHARRLLQAGGRRVGGRHRQRRRHRRHAQQRRRFHRRPQSVDHRRRQSRRHQRAAFGPHPGQRRHTARRLGGSLVNTAGQVIGIDTAASQSSSFQSSGNQGFCHPH